MNTNGTLARDVQSAVTARKGQERNHRIMQPGREFLRNNALGLAALLFTLALAAFLLPRNLGGAHKTAFVDTQRLMIGFKEANKANKEVEAEDAKWKADLKKLEEGLKAHMDTMSAKYDAADAKGKREMQDDLSARNQQVNNFEKANTKKMQELSGKKLSAVFEKVNAFMKEYGKTQGYDVIFGTAQGSILYGEGTRADITDKVIAELNKRYE